MFRASPWISYAPTADIRNTGELDNSASKLDDHSMDEDIDMDAPQISTLREEETPPPQPTRTSKFRVKLLVTEAKNAASSSTNASRKQRPAGHIEGEEEEEEEEEEEDQLIDDDDDVKINTPPPPVRPVDTPVKRKSSAKRRPRKSATGEKRTQEDEKKLRDKLPAVDPQPMPWPDLPYPDQPQVDTETPPQSNWDGPHAVEESLLPDASTSKPRIIPAVKKNTKARPSALPSRARKAQPKPNKNLAIPTFDDSGILSEGYTGTAASSPVTVQHDANSPEPDPMAPSIITPVVDDVNYDSVPLPVYPLPSKPFPVQPPSKIGSGFAPVIPLDKGGKKVRHWRTANREIRGIAGGRWFARAWVGEKESEYASAVTAAAAAAKAQAVATEASGDKQAKLPVASISAPPGGKAKFKVPKPQATASASASAGPSRSGSMVPDPHAVRAPTKMRTILAAPSDTGNDSDMAPPEL